MDGAEEDALAYTTFSARHRAKPHSTNLVGRPNAEIRRRTDVVGVFPNEAAITCRVGAVIVGRPGSGPPGAPTTRRRNRGPIGDDTSVGLPAAQTA